MVAPHGLAKLRGTLGESNQSEMPEIQRHDRLASSTSMVWLPITHEPARRSGVGRVVLCCSAYGGASCGVEGLEFTGDVRPGGLVDDFGDAVRRRVR